MKRIAWILAGIVTVLLILAHAPLSPDRDRLPCADRDLRPGSFWLFCVLGRNYVQEGGVDVLRTAHRAVKAEHGVTSITWLDGSGPWTGGLWPHRSHSNGRQIDVALYYETVEGQPLRRPPTFSGYFAYEPPEPGEETPCARGRRPADFGDPAADRSWRWDEARTGTLVRALIADDRVRRILLEPHLAARLGLNGHTKVRFASCAAARHDDHIHIDLH